MIFCNKKLILFITYAWVTIQNIFFNELPKKYISYSVQDVHSKPLTSFSPLFKNLLKSNKHQHPMIYMRGVKFEELHAILDFLYCGEANVHQDHLDSFLAMADELKLKGLTGEREDKKNERSSFVSGNDFAKEPYYQSWKKSEISVLEHKWHKYKKTENTQIYFPTQQNISLHFLSCYQSST